MKRIENRYLDPAVNINDQLTQNGGASQQNNLRFMSEVRTEAEIVNRLAAGLYPNGYELLRDLTSSLIWAERYNFLLYDKRPTLRAEFPVDNDFVFLPVYNPLNREELVDIIRDGYEWLLPAWDEDTENFLFEHLITLFTHKPSYLEDPTPLKPTIRETMSNPESWVLVVEDHDLDRQRFASQDFSYTKHPVEELQWLLHQAMVLSNQFPWMITKSRLRRAKYICPDDHVVLYYSRNEQTNQHLRRLRRCLIS